MLKVKCRNEEFCLNEEDIILYNGACYQIITRRVRSGWYEYHPILAKAKAKKLIKDGDLVLDKEDIKSGLMYYKIK